MSGLAEPLAIVVPHTRALAPAPSPTKHDTVSSVFTDLYLLHCAYWNPLTKSLATDGCRLARVNSSVNTHHAYTLTLTLTYTTSPAILDAIVSGLDK